MVSAAKANDVIRSKKLQEEEERMGQKGDSKKEERVEKSSGSEVCGFDDVCAGFQMIDNDVASTTGASGGSKHCQHTPEKCK